MMKTTRRFLIPLFLLFPFFTLVAQDELTHDWDLEDLICKEQESAEFHLFQRGLRNEYASQTDIFYQSMHWEIDPAQNYIKGEITYYFKSRIEDLTELHLDMKNTLQINSILHQAAPLTYTLSADHVLTITLDKSLAAGETDSITISYEGAPIATGYGSFKQGSHNGKPIVWTLSEPYGNRDWWPGKQDLIDKIDSVDIFITTPPGQLAASNGKLVRISEQNGKLIHHWKHRYPIVSYLIALAVTNYAAYSHYLPLQNGDTIEILNYVYPETLTQSQIATQSSLDIMTLFNELFGIYPFASEKYGHAQFGWGGGEEHQTMSFMGNFDFNLQAHEMAHQWFGDKVTCGSWTEIWLNEGFATYLTGLTFQRYSENQYWPLWKTSTSNSVTSQPGGSVYVDDTTNINRIFSGRLSYNKGAYLLHMLRWIIGDDAFFAACRDYLDLPGTAYDFGQTEELQGYLEHRSGKDLDEFFKDWYYGQGYPSYQLRWSQQADSVIFWLGQSQSHVSVSFFEMPVPVSVNLNGTPATFILDHNLQDQRFSFYVGNTTVDNVSVDPEIWLLSKNNTITEITTSTYNTIAQSKYIVYPNPAKDYLEFLPATEVHSIDFIDAYGQKRDITLTSGRIELSAMPSGHYTLILKNSSAAILSIQQIVIAK